MAELFHNRERALFGQARPVELAPLPEAELIGYVGSRFEATGRDPGPTLPPLANLAQGRTALLNGGAVAGQGSRLTIIDPLFAAWNRRGPPQPVSSLSRSVPAERLRTPDSTGRRNSVYLSGT